MNRIWDLINKTTLYLLVFLLPTQLAIHFWPSWAFVFGIRVDYLAPTIYLTDILSFLLILLNIEIYKKYLKWFLVLILLAFVNILLSTIPWLSFYKWLKIVELVLLGIYFAQPFIKKGKILGLLFASGIVFSLIGILQFVTGGTLGGALYFLGERTFNISTSGIALVDLFGRNFLRAYSTFPHPNSLAGFLGVVLILLFDFKYTNKYKAIGLVIVLAGFFLTFSLTASIALCLALVIKYAFSKTQVFKKVGLMIFFFSFVLSLLLPLFSRNLLNYGKRLGTSFTQRAELSFLAGKMIGERFVVGEGLNTFIANSPRFEGVSSRLWLLQPVHNVPLLVFSETGILGLLFLFWLFHKTFKKFLNEKEVNIVVALIFVLITWTIDHYWFTLQQNLLLLSLLLGFSLRQNRD